MTTESHIENTLIAKLQAQKYRYRSDIRDCAALEQNFRAHFEALNQVQLSDREFTRLLAQIISPDVFANAKHLREQNTFERDDGTPLQYMLVNIRDWCKNSFEVVNQLRINTHSSHHRYDVILLINGVPVVQIELKAPPLSPRRAMQQIVDYKNDQGNGYTRTLLCFMQIFIVSNQVQTIYFANNNRQHFNFDAEERFLPIYQFADEHNKKIGHLNDFAEGFLAKCTLGEMIGRYMVLVSGEQKLMMMRPYQIYAVKNIVKSIQQNCGNGYIWHTTGSGKTLTSFKASTLLKDNNDIHKCLFVVDRKDLDRQTRLEFNKFQEGCVEANTNTETLVQRLLSHNHADKVIVTTIQKLGRALDNRKDYQARLKPLQDKRIVFIFDECHRSQFGENHQAIKTFFPKAQLFGFTGTPIFDENASTKQITDSRAELKTTKDIFQHQLHRYTITHAIEDHNVLRFHVDYYKPEGDNIPKRGEALSKRAIISAVLDKHTTSTNHRKFNAIFATASINDAIEYYQLFNTIQAERQAVAPETIALNIACVFSPPPGESPEVRQMSEDLQQETADYAEDAADAEKVAAKKTALVNIIADYNAQFNSNFSIHEFDLYYQDVQQRIKDQQYPNTEQTPQAHKIDITIVVDMLLTGFDAKYLNTLYVDKNLKYHGLIQAFSRTNRVLNDSKPYGNIVDFREQQAQVDKAVLMFSGEQTPAQAKKIWMVEDAPTMIEKYQDAVQTLSDFMHSHDLPVAAHAVNNLQGDTARVQFVQQFKEIQRIKTQLDQYTDLTPEQDECILATLPKDDLQSFRAVYLDTAKRLRQPTNHNEPAPAELAELDFEFVLFSTALIDFDYIHALLANYTHGAPTKVKMSKADIIALIQSDAKFVDEQADLVEYINTLQVGVGLDEEAIKNGYQRFKQKKLWGEYQHIATQHGLNFEALKTMIERVRDRLIFNAEDLDPLLEPFDLGWKARDQKAQAIMTALIPPLKSMAAGQEISGLAVYEPNPAQID